VEHTSYGSTQGRDPRFRRAGERGFGQFLLLRLGGRCARTMPNPARLGVRCAHQGQGGPRASVGQGGQPQPGPKFKYKLAWTPGGGFAPVFVI